MKALICNELCFHKTEINRFGPNSGGVFLTQGCARKPFSNNIPFLKGYQGNVCLYCGEHIDVSDIHVDHVIPRQVVRHHEILSKYRDNTALLNFKNGNIGIFSVTVYAEKPVLESLIFNDSN